MIKSLCCLCLFMLCLAAKAFPNTGPSLDMLAVGKDLVHVVSPFDSIDYFSTYSLSGELIWEVPFSAQVISWKANEDGLLYIFSMNRGGLAYYLTCVEQATGSFVWEKPIFSPMVLDNTQNP